MAIFNLQESIDYIHTCIKAGKGGFFMETEFGKVAYEKDFGFENPQGIILETENKSIRVRLTFSQVLEQILDKNREELTSTLFGGDL